MPGELKDWLGAVAVVISLLTSVYAWLTSKAKANSEHLKTVDAKMTDLDRRTQALEAEQKHMPSKDDVNDLKLEIAEMNGTMKALGGEVAGVSRTVRRVEGFLLKESD